MPNHAGVLQSLFFPAKLETEGDGSIFNTLLRPMHETCDDRFSPVARFVLYVRGHSLRMPAHLLIPHLLRKAAIRSNLLPEAANPR
ncbi:protein of unknown function [Thauera humireducens]|uniref:hypothetical protein n=1 Tax=Thauera humireducens TaxID=1134435 RepID=UPI002467A8B4|nr:hypothetical protein [Thauera humireducens]CAH1747424.1 protein of unknown function [Thauera humireducens]